MGLDRPGRKSDGRYAGAARSRQGKSGIDGRRGCSFAREDTGGSSRRKCGRNYPDRLGVCVLSGGWGV